MLVGSRIKTRSTSKAHGQRSHFGTFHQTFGHFVSEESVYFTGVGMQDTPA